MRLLIQRVAHAKVSVNDKILGEINKGLLIFVGFTHEDNLKTISRMVDKLLGLRIFSDENDKMNLAIKDIKGEILTISQFTLYADCLKGNRPNFINAANPALALKLYQEFNNDISNKYLKAKEGEFGADMQVELLNYGPVTIFLDSIDFI